MIEPHHSCHRLPKLMSSVFFFFKVDVEPHEQFTNFISYVCVITFTLILVVKVITYFSFLSTLSCSVENSAAIILVYGPSLIEG